MSSHFKKMRLQLASAQAAADLASYRALGLKSTLCSQVLYRSFDGFLAPSQVEVLREKLESAEELNADMHNFLDDTDTESPVSPPSLSPLRPQRPQQHLQKHSLFLCTNLQILQHFCLTPLLSWSLCLRLCPRLRL